MPTSRLKELLDKERINYATINHQVAYTAQETVSAAHLPGRQVAKTVMVNADGRLVMIVLPASYKIDLEALRKELNVKTCSLAREEDFITSFPDCELGALPPFGNLYGKDV